MVWVGGYAGPAGNSCSRTVEVVGMGLCRLGRARIHIGRDRAGLGAFMMTFEILRD